MKCNVADFDRVIRFILGVILTTWAIAGGPGWGYSGIYLLATSGWGFCLVYASLKINTIKELKDSQRNPIFNINKEPENESKTERSL
jgi:hypothetical protein